MNQMEEEFTLLRIKEPFKNIPSFNSLMQSSY